jgi:isoamylase
MFLNGDGLPDPGPHGESIIDDSFFIVFNADNSGIDFHLPGPGYGESWTTVIDTNDPHVVEGIHIYKAKDVLMLEARSVVVLRRVESPLPSAVG